MIMEHFQELTDPRIAWAKRHNLLDIVALTICAVVCGADNWVEIAEFGQAKADGLRRFLALPKGILTHNTLGRVFSRRDPEQFQAGFPDGGAVGKPADPARQRRPLLRVRAWATAQPGHCRPGGTGLY